MFARRKRRWFAGKSQSAVTFATLGRWPIPWDRSHKERWGKREKGNDASPPAHALAKRTTLSIVGWLSTAAGFTVVTRRRHQLADPPRCRIMTLYSRLAISPLPLWCLIADRPAGKIIYEERWASLRVATTGPALSWATCRSTELSWVCGPSVTIDRWWWGLTDLTHRHATTSCLPVGGPPWTTTNVEAAVLRYSWSLSSSPVLLIYLTMFLIRYCTTWIIVP